MSSFMPGDRALLDVVVQTNFFNDEVVVEAQRGGDRGSTLVNVSTAALRPWTKRPDPPYVDPEFIPWCAYRDADHPDTYDVGVIYLGDGEWLNPDRSLCTRDNLPARLMQVTAPVSTSDSTGEQ